MPIPRPVRTAATPPPLTASISWPGATPFRVFATIHKNAISTVQFAEEPITVPTPGAGSTGTAPRVEFSNAARLGAILALQVIVAPTGAVEAMFTLKVTEKTPLAATGAAPLRWSAAGTAHSAADTSSAGNRVREARALHGALRTLLIGTPGFGNQEKCSAKPPGRVRK